MPELDLFKNIKFPSFVQFETSICKVKNMQDLRDLESKVVNPFLEFLDKLYTSPEVEKIYELAEKEWYATHRNCVTKGCLHCCSFCCAEKEEGGNIKFPRREYYRRNED